LSPIFQYFIDITEDYAGKPYIENIVFRKITAVFPAGICTIQRFLHSAAEEDGDAGLWL